MNKVKSMTYVKENGDYSRRQVIVVSEPSKNFLVLDVSKLTTEQIETLTAYMSQAEEFRENLLQEFDVLTGIQYNRLWRSFKPGGIEWDTENEI